MKQQPNQVKNRKVEIDPTYFDLSNYSKGEDLYTQDRDELTFLVQQLSGLVSTICVQIARAGLLEPETIRALSLFCLCSYALATPPKIRGYGVTMSLGMEYWLNAYFPEEAYGDKGGEQGIDLKTLLSTVRDMLEVIEQREKDAAKQE